MTQTTYVALSNVGHGDAWNVYGMAPTQTEVRMQAWKAIDAAFPKYGDDNNRRVRLNLIVIGYTSAVRHYPYRHAIARYENEEANR